MICPECGHETEGNFCSNCGILLNEEPVGLDNGYRAGNWRGNGIVPSSQGEGEARTPNSSKNDSRRGGSRRKDKVKRARGRKETSHRDKKTVDKKEERLEKKEKKLRESRIRNLEQEVEQLTIRQRLRERRRSEWEEGEPDSGSDIVELAAKGATGALVITSRLMQILSVFLMVAMVLVMAQSFLIHLEGLGNIRRIVEERNYGLALYMGFAGSSLFMGLIWSLWIFSRKGAGGGLRLKKYDTGRGFIPFLICAAFILVSGPALAQIPPALELLEEWRNIAEGGRAALMAINGQKGILMSCSVAGVLLSLIRKILRV